MTTTYREPLQRELRLWIRFCPDRHEDAIPGVTCAGTCGRRLRRRGETEPAENRVVVARGMCSTCYRDIPRTRVLVTPYQPCAGPCGRPLRPKMSTRTSYPGTVRCESLAMCGYCYRRRNQ